MTAPTSTETGGLVQHWAADHRHVTTTLLPRVVTGEVIQISVDPSS